jgi:hypothetical protein
VPAHANGEPLRVTACLLNRLAQLLRDIEALPDA